MKAAPLHDVARPVPGVSVGIVAVVGLGSRDVVKAAPLHGVALPGASVGPGVVVIPPVGVNLAAPLHVVALPGASAAPVFQGELGAAAAVNPLPAVEPAAEIVDAEERLPAGAPDGKMERKERREEGRTYEEQLGSKLKGNKNSLTIYKM
jgi:hypothetical protein